jgi:hypothetical protein
MAPFLRNCHSAPRPPLAPGPLLLRPPKPPGKLTRSRWAAVERFASWTVRDDEPPVLVVKDMAG